MVYLSGPMTAKHGFSIEENVAAGVKVFLACLKQGIPAICPHLSGAFPSAWGDVSPLIKVSVGESTATPPRPNAPATFTITGTFTGTVQVAP